MLILETRYMKHVPKTEVFSSTSSALALSLDTAHNMFQEVNVPTQHEMLSL